jgi:hypothetical protein
MDESTEWKAPEFTYKRNITTFNPGSRVQESLRFHVGSSTAACHPRLGGHAAVEISDLVAADVVSPISPNRKAIVAAWSAMKSGDTQSL